MRASSFSNWEDLSWVWAAAAARDKLQSDINVTPLVDVCLVLLIIFMVVTPMLQKGDQRPDPAADNPGQEAGVEKQKLISIT